MGGPQRYASDGLNSLKYKLLKMEKKPLYTWVYVSINEQEVLKSFPEEEVPPGLDWDFLDQNSVTTIVNATKLLEKYRKNQNPQTLNNTKWL